MRFSSVLLAMMIFIGTLSVLYAEEESKPYRIASYHIPLLVEDANHGAFIDMLREAARRAGIRYTIVMSPAKRAMRYFEDGDVIGIIPALSATLAADAALTRPIFTKQIHAFVRKGDPLSETISSLEGKRVGLTRGFSYPRAITVNEKIEIDYADTTAGSLKKLLEGRVDVVVADGYTAQRAIEKEGLSGFHYDLSAVLNEQVAYIAFQNTAEGAALARKISQALETMEQDGTMAKLLPDISGSSE